MAWIKMEHPDHVCFLPNHPYVTYIGEGSIWECDLCKTQWVWVRGVHGTIVTEPRWERRDRVTKTLKEGETHDGS